MPADLNARRISALDSRTAIAPVRRIALAGIGATLLLAGCLRQASAQEAAAPIAASIFEIERPRSLVNLRVPVEQLAPTTDLSLYLARYHLVTKTLAGTAAGALTGAALVFLTCSGADDQGESHEFLDTGGCLNRDRWFGFVAGGSFLGTILGGARGASLSGGTFGTLSPLRTSECSFREGLRRAFIGTVAGSIPMVVYFAGGGGAAESSLLAPLFQSGGAIVAIWGCIGEPRLGPIGPPPMP